jgi:hypothetical protein
MQEIQGIIERVKRVSTTLQRVDVVLNQGQASVGVAPGQLFLVRSTPSLDPFLREPWTPVARDGARLTVELSGEVTYRTEQFVSLIGPIGRPIPLRDTIRALLLVVFEATPAALLTLANAVIGRKGAVVLVLVGAAAQYPLDLLPMEIEVIRAETLTRWENRDYHLKWADQIVALAPPPHDAARYRELMDEAKRVRLTMPEGFAYGLFQPPLPCGIGACAACLVRWDGDDVPACLEGPAFDLAKL